MLIRAFPRHGGRLASFVALHMILALASARGGEPRPLFDGKSFEGWEGDTKQTWRIENGAIVAGSLDAKVPRDDFLCTKRAFEHFELALKYRLEGTGEFVKSGVQFHGDGKTLIRFEDIRIEELAE